MKNKKFCNFGIGVLFICNFALAGCQNQYLHKDNRVMMGTFVEVTAQDGRAAVIVFDEFKRVEGLLSKYNPQSEVSRLNAAGRLKVSPETFSLLKKAKEFWGLTDGALDITVAPLIDLWGFTDKRYRVPDQKEIKDTLTRVGMDKIRFKEDDSVVEFIVPAMKIDLGAIAKGYALDCAVRKLKQNNIESCLINAGGQVFCLGEKPGGPWRIAINDPEGRGLRGFLELKDKSAATAGGYEQFFVKDKKRYAHIIDPKTGFPAESGTVSVTVVADDGLTADALSTAIFVLGKEKAGRLLTKFPGVEAKIIEKVHLGES